MTLSYTTVAGTAISLAQLVDGIIQTIRISNSETAAVDVKMCLKAYDGKASEDATNLEGKEISSEGWVCVRKTGDSAWNQISEPTTWPDSWDDLTEGCFIFEIGASSYQDIDVKIVIPDDPDSTGITHFSICMMEYPA